MRFRSGMRLAIPVLLAMVFFGVQTAVHADGCIIHIFRTACSGKEAESFKKCGGNASCDETLAASTPQECAKAALKACDNSRLDITMSKVITAVFNGRPVEGGRNFCAADRPDFNKCSK